MTKEKLAIEVIKRLKTAYPRTDCTLEYDEAWKLLVSVRLAAQCTDARVIPTNSTPSILSTLKVAEIGPPEGRSVE